MLCTSLCSRAGTLMRRTSPCTRIIGGRPEDRCRSDALFLTTKASSSVKSITILPDANARNSTLFQRIMATIADNLQDIKARLARAREVTLLAASKSQPVRLIAEAVAAGQRAFGENYVQEAIEKMDALRASGSELEWHLIGPLQSNKTRVVAERFDWVRTVAIEKIARRLSEQRPAALEPLNVLIQVNVSGEATKSGVAAEEVGFLSKKIKPLQGLRLRG